MARTFRALCLRDTVQDAAPDGSRSYVRYRRDQEYMISEDSPVLEHFRPLEELPKKEAERVKAEEDLAKPVDSPRKRK